MLPQKSEGFGTTHDRGALSKFHRLLFQIKVVNVKKSKTTFINIAILSLYFYDTRNITRNQEETRYVYQSKRLSKIRIFHPQREL